MKNKFNIINYVNDYLNNISDFGYVNTNDIYNYIFNEINIKFPNINLLNDEINKIKTLISITKQDYLKQNSKKAILVNKKFFKIKSKYNFDLSDNIYEYDKSFINFPAYIFKIDESKNNLKKLIYLKLMNLKII